ncbi:hypothetical protein TUM17567_15610 [Citrobacter amalonaticus]|nr:hypothetical protein TUM17567_15610 [Citrobacter amalonaticus]
MDYCSELFHLVSLHQMELKAHQEQLYSEVLTQLTMLTAQAQAQEPTLLMVLPCQMLT